MISKEPEYFKLVPDEDFITPNPLRNEIFQNKYKKESLKIFDALGKLLTRRDLPSSKKIALMNNLLNNFQQNLEKTNSAVRPPKNIIKETTESTTSSPTSQNKVVIMKQKRRLVPLKKSKSSPEYLKKVSKLSKKRKIDSEPSDTYSESSDVESSFSSPSYSPVKMKKAVPTSTFTTPAGKKIKNIYIPPNVEQNLSNDFKSKLSFVESPDSATIGSLTYPGYQKVEKSYRNNARDLLLHAIEKGLHFNRRTLDGYGNFKIDTYLQNLTNTKNTDTSSEAVEATQRFIKDFDIPNRFIKNAFYRNSTSQLGRGLYRKSSFLSSPSGNGRKKKKITWLNFKK